MLSKLLVFQEVNTMTTYRSKIAEFAEQVCYW